MLKPDDPRQVQYRAAVQRREAQPESYHGELDPLNVVVWSTVVLVVVAFVGCVCIVVGTLAAWAARTWGWV